MAKKRIGILTGGGDVPGLNSVIKTVTYRSSEDDIEVVGLRRGWEALTHLDCDDPTSRRRYVMPLDRANTRTIDRRGGTVLHSSRTNPSNMQKLPDHLAGKNFPASLNCESGIASETWDLSRQVLANLTTLGIDHLIVIGGDDTLGYAAKLDELGVGHRHSEDHGQRCSQHRVLHRLLDSNHPSLRRHTASTHDCRFARTDWHFPRLRPRRRIYSALRRVCHLSSGAAVLTFGNIAYDAILDGKSGLMSALVNGCYELVPIPDPNLGPRKLDVATTYNTDRYRPMYANKQGLPVFLNRASKERSNTS
jgi:Phosphofructokinase